MRHIAVTLSATLAIVVLAGVGAAATLGWTVVRKGPTVGAGEIAFVGSIVRRPAKVGVRATTASSETIVLTVTTSCRKGLKTRVGREQITGRAPYTRSIRLPLAGADHCAISATGKSAAGTMRLELLRS